MDLEPGRVTVPSIFLDGLEIELLKGSGGRRDRTAGLDGPSALSRITRAGLEGGGGRREGRRRGNSAHIRRRRVRGDKKQRSTEEDRRDEASVTGRPALRYVHCRAIGSALGCGGKGNAKMQIKNPDRGKRLIIRNESIFIGRNQVVNLDLC